MAELGHWDVNGIKLDGKLCPSGVDALGSARVYTNGGQVFADVYAEYRNACAIDDISPSVAVGFFEGGNNLGQISVPVPVVPARGFQPPTARSATATLQLPSGHTLDRIEWTFVNNGTGSTSIRQTHMAVPLP